MWDSALYVLNDDTSISEARYRSSEMLVDVIDDLLQLEEGVLMYGVACDEVVLVIAPLNFIIADNARHSELACHKGARSNFPCRKCLYQSKPPGAVTSIEHHNGLATTGPLEYLHAINTGSSLRLLSTSFVGRDVKIMSQQLPVILHYLLHHEWFNLINTREAVIEARFTCFAVRGELASLVYIGHIQNDFEQYNILMHQKVCDLTAAIRRVEENCNTFHIAGSRVISNTSKLHMLRYLKDDLARFASAIHFESEKGEQFDKFIRKQIFHTNRHNPSGDVLSLFGRQFIFRHILDGGYWEDRDARVTATDAIVNYKQGLPGFELIYLDGDREFSDNNTSVNEFKKAIARFFIDRRTTRLIVGETMDIAKEGAEQQYTRPPSQNISS
ncbi:hypothetical protein BX666DRAFT_1877986 [Dichotomocladium elegans]|nr:hypothetical protein BX666DRAFT_1877986 [Dichotomocladium elegans]